MFPSRIERRMDFCRAALGSLLVLASMLGSVLPDAALAEEAAVIDNSASTQALRKLKRKPGVKPVVTVYEVRSSAPEVPPKAAQEMFMTALIKSGAFAVAERARLNEGVMRERALMAGGVASGSAASATVAGAEYLFEVVVSEANAGARQSDNSVSVGGMQVGSSGGDDEIGMDIRIVDTTTGLVIDALNVHKKIASSTTSVSGIGQLAQSLFSLKGRSMPVSVDANSRSSRSESVDQALRSCIEVGVTELARRFNQD